MRTVDWDPKSKSVVMIDQRLLPGEFRLVNFHTAAEVSLAIRDMVVRGAPAIGAAAAFGLALTAVHAEASDCHSLTTALQADRHILASARPTAVNLRWALDRMLAVADAFEGPVDMMRLMLEQEACRIADEDVTINKRMAEHGAALIDDGDTVIHHCNTGSLATVDWGTALGVIRKAYEQGKRIHVLVDETRPRLQGARLTAWELEQYGIPFDIIPDNAAGYFLRTGQAHKVFYGADRVAANGDVANKIGTYMLSLAAFDNHIPAYAVVPTSTIDLTLEHGGLIPIEERSPDEVLNLQAGGQQVAPLGASARNPAFDVTPHRLVSGIVTENGVAYPPYSISLIRAVHGELG